MQQFERDKNVIKKVILWLLIIVCMYVMTLFKMPLFVINAFFILSTSVILCLMWKDNLGSKLEITLILIGFVLRIVVCYIDIYARELITIPFSGADSEGFYLTSVAYYSGDMSAVYTKYPYLLNIMYKIVGLNRFAVQYVNILCWCFCTLIMQKACTLLNVNKYLRVIALGILAIMPFHICISSILMRDMIVALAIMLTTYLTMKWMQDGNYTNLLLGVLVSALAMLMHNCTVAVLGVITIMAALYSPEKNKFSIDKKTVVICALGVTGLAILVLVPAVRSVVLSQIPTADGGILVAINGRLGYFYRNTGGSTYLLNEYVDNYWELFVGTFQRMGYFLFSPVPWMWRGLSDIAGFMMSVSVVITSFTAMSISFFYKKKDDVRTLLLAIVLLVSAIFAWAVSNGGTALRHREKLLGVLILLGVYSVQIIINARRERKNA